MVKTETVAIFAVLTPEKYQEFQSNPKRKTFTGNPVDSKVWYCSAPKLRERTYESIEHEAMYWLDRCKKMYGKDFVLLRLWESLPQFAEQAQKELRI